MWLNIIFIVVLFLVAFIGFTGYSFAKDNNNANNSALEQLSKINLSSKLEQLPEEPVVKDYPQGAMCYRVASPPERAEYICPVCGEMTLYPSCYNRELDNIRSYQVLINRITKLEVKLDESHFCKKCSPDIKSRELCLIVKLKNNKKAQEHKTCDITEEDINLLYEYSEGIKEHSTEFGNTPLINYKDRLEELLGTTIRDLKN